MSDFDFKKAIEDYRQVGYMPEMNLVQINIPDARNLIKRGIDYYTNNNGMWLPEYEEIADWLTDNKGKGLFCMGDCGRGKTLICWRIIPLLIQNYCRRIVNCYDMQQANDRIDEVKSKHLIMLDDVGTESVAVKYGEKRQAFSEIVDEAEKKGKLLIVTTNISSDEIIEKYGIRTLDRLTAITRKVVFKGKSQRK